ncbi:MAG: hypothetical protein KA190_30710 [Kofleriaceae bacterium]|nr:hypothetical protein [Kofleriaceae bacterium]
MNGARVWSSRFLLALAVAAAACGGASPPSSKPTAATPPPATGDGVALTQPAPTAALPIPTDATAPADLMARGFVASPARLITDAAAFANTVMPGMGAQLSPDLLLAMIGPALGTQPLAGLDASRPVALAVLDPGAYPQPMLLAAGVTDRAAFDAAMDGGPSTVRAIHFAGGVVVIGPDAALTAGAGWLAAQVAAPPTGAPTAPTLTVHLDQVWARHGDRVREVMRGAGQAAMLDKLTSEITTSMVDGLLNTRELVVTLDVGATEASATATVRAAPDSGVARFAAAQHPASFALLTRLASGPGIVVGGELQFEQFIDAMLALVGPKDGATAAEAARYREAMRTVYQGLSGPMAMRMDVAGGRTSMTMMMGSARPAATAAAMAAVTAAGLSPEVAATVQRGGFRHKKVRGDVITTTVRPSAPAAVRQSMETAWGGPAATSVVVALADAVVMAIGQDAKAMLVRQLDGGATAASPELTTAIAGASARRASLLVYFDLLGMIAAQRAAPGATVPAPAVPAPLPIEIGFGGADTWLRVGMSADTVRALALGAKP